MSVYLKGKHEIVRDWWTALDGSRESVPPKDTAKRHTRFLFDRGDRARLRRAQTIADAALEPSVWQLAAALGLEESDNEALLLVTSALAHVKEDAEDNRSLAYLLGAAPAGRDEKPKLSGLRFQRMMRSKEPDELLQQIRRALSVGDGRADVAVLADDLFAWSSERKYADRRRSGMTFRWARDYYLKRAEQALVPDPTT